MADIDKAMEELKQKRDELELKIHLGSMDAKTEWEELEKKWNDFSAKAELQRTSDEIDAAFDLLGDELKKGYERLKKAL